MRLAGLDGEQVNVTEKAIAALSPRLDGRLLRRGEGDFADAVRIWNGMVTKTPSLVVQPLGPHDVRTVVEFARANGVLLSIKGGGHNIGGTSLADGGVTVDMVRLKGVEVDERRRLAHVAPGCLLRDVDRATQERGLATVLGMVTETGVAGLTLGGGFGYLTRRFGWTVDNLEEVEILTADGALRRASASEHEDLFWALSGGGGNFGVVTRFTFRLHEVGPEITGGLVVWDVEAADGVLALYRAVAEAAPRELTLGVAIRFAPPAPFIPERWHGKQVVVVFACHSGDASRAAEDLAPFRTFGRPIVTAMGPKPYVAQQSLFDGTQPKGTHNYWKSEFLPPLSDAVLETFRRQGDGMASPMSLLMLIQLGGALADRDPDASAFGNRDADSFFAAAACWRPDDPVGDDERGWARRAWEAMRPHSTGGNYINMQTGEDDETRLREAYGDSLTRLAEVKAAYDAENLFRVNRNIAPRHPAFASA